MPAGSDDLSLRFARHLERTGLLHGVECPLVGLSGGLDSVCLLHLLRFTTPRTAVVAAHFDHAMRPDSAGDAAWVRGLCRSWEVPLGEGRAVDPPRSETSARRLRYTFLRQQAERLGADAILTAHHANDQAETVLFRLARGTGMTGLAGIRARRGDLIRPLLPFTRDELHAYARARGIQWREDPTNRRVRWARNRIRRDVLSALELVRPGATRRIAELAEGAAEAESAWRTVVRGALGRVLLGRSEGEFVLARERLLAYHPHVRARVLRCLLNELGSRPDRSGTRAAVEFISTGASGGGIALAGGVRLEREFERIHIRRRAGTTAAEVRLAIHAAEAGSGGFVAGGQRFRAEWWPEPRDIEAGRAAVFDSSSLAFPLELRSWQPGDRIRLGYGRKKLKKLLRERRVGRWARARVPVLQDATGRILWVVGVARSSDAQPRPDQPVFTVTVLDGDSL